MAKRSFIKVSLVGSGDKVLIPVDEIKCIAEIKKGQTFSGSPKISTSEHFFITKESIRKIHRKIRWS